MTAYAENDNGYWLKLYHFAGNIDPIVFDNLQAKYDAIRKEDLEAALIKPRL